MTNPFEALADAQQNAFAKRRERDAERRASKHVVTSEADAPMKGSAMEQARDERNAQMAGYRRAKAEERDELLNGAYRHEIAALSETLKRLTMASAGELVERVMSSTFKCADLDTRQAVLSMIGDAIMKLRTRNGKPPFDDSIGDDPPTAFQVIRKEMMGV